MKRKEEPLLNVLEEIVEEERLFDNEYLQIKSKKKRIRKAGFINERKAHIFRAMEEVFIENSIRIEFKLGKITFRELPVLER